MRKLKQILAAILVASVLGVGAVAQKGDDKRPPKEDNKVKVREKDKPPQNSNQGNSGNSNRRRP